MTQDNRLSPIQACSFPEYKFSLRFINDNIVQFCNDDGNSPEKLLLLKANVLRLIKETIEIGVSPDKLLLTNFRILSSCHCMKQLGEASKKPVV